MRRPSGYTINPSTGLAAIFLSIMALNACAQQAPLSE
jgi:hypothetical protein